MLAAMTDASTALEPNKPTVAASANQCLESFQQCLLQASYIHPRELSLVEDQVARFSTWMRGIGVFAPGRASMDHRLRFAPEVQSVAIGLLESLNYRIQNCSNALDVHSKGLATNIASVPNETLDRCFGEIAIEISHLNKMSNMIRRASKETQILKAGDFRIKDEEGNDVEPLLLLHFAHHIGDRFPEISDTIQQRLARTMLLRRKRILHRRYRQGNAAIQLEEAAPKVSISFPDSRQPGPSAQGNLLENIIRDAGRKVAMAEPSQIRSATTLQPDKFKITASSPSVVSATETVALGNHETFNFPPAPGLAVKQRFERLKSQRLAAHQAKMHKLDELYAAMDSTDAKVPRTLAQKIAEEKASAEEKLQEILKLDLQAIGEIICPFCLYTLPADEVFNERQWRNHVKSDLDPYVCLVEDCNQPDELFNHSDRWISHLHQHGQRWRCSSHRELDPFLNREDYMHHMREVHETKLSDAKLRILANKNSRKPTRLFLSCPLCGVGDAEVDTRLEDHIAGHLRSLALKSLPSYQDEIPDDAGNESDDSGNSQPRSRSTVNNLSNDEDMLDLRARYFEDDGETRLTRSKSTNFLGEVHSDLDESHKDAWTSWLADWNSDKLLSTDSLMGIGDDPILQSMQQARNRDNAIGSLGDEEPNHAMDQNIRDLSNALIDEATSRDDATSSPDEESPSQQINDGQDEPGNSASLGDISLNDLEVEEHHHGQSIRILIRPLIKLPNVRPVGGDDCWWLALRADAASPDQPAQKILAVTQTQKDIKFSIRIPGSTTNDSSRPPLWCELYYDPASDNVILLNRSDVPITISRVSSKVAGLLLIDDDPVNPGMVKSLEPGTFRITVEEIQILEFRILEKRSIAHEEPPRLDDVDTSQPVAKIATEHGVPGIDEPNTRESDDKAQLSPAAKSEREFMADSSPVYTDHAKPPSPLEVMSDGQRRGIHMSNTVVSQLDESRRLTELATTYGDQGRWREAEKLQVKAVDINQEVLGEKHPITLDTMSHLALILDKHGRLNEAEELQTRVMESRIERLGEDHPETLDAMAHLAHSIGHQGRWKEAEKLQIQVMERREAIFGENYTGTLEVMSHLALNFCEQGRRKEAEKLQMQVMERMKAKFGEDHIATQEIMSHLAFNLYNQGRWKEAEKLQMQVLERMKAEFGEDHFATLDIMSYLAVNLNEQGRLKEAEEFQLQAMEGFRKTLGKNHPHTLGAMTLLGLIYRKGGQLKEAEEILILAVEQHRERFGEDHPSTLQSMEMLAVTLKQLGRDAEAIVWMENCHRSRQRILGLEHPSTLSVKKTLDEWRRN